MLFFKAKYNLRLWSGLIVRWLILIIYILYVNAACATSQTQIGRGCLYWWEVKPVIYFRQSVQVWEGISRSWTVTSVWLQDCCAPPGLRQLRNMLPVWGFSVLSKSTSAFKLEKLRIKPARFPTTVERPSLCYQHWSQMYICMYAWLYLDSSEKCWL